MAIIKDAITDDCLYVDPTYNAIRTSVRSPGVDGGYYRTTLLSGTINGLTAGSIIYAFRNPSTNLCVVQNVSIGFRAIASSTKTSFVVSIYFTRNYTVMDTTGAATAPTLIDKVMTINRSTQMNALQRISNTGALSGGTGTDDSQPLASAVFTHPGAISNVGLYTTTLFQQATGLTQGQGLGGGVGTWVHPLVIAQNEGFRIRADTSLIAGTNTLVAYVDVDWFEASSF